MLLLDSVQRIGGAVADFVFPRLCGECNQRILEPKRLVCCHCEAAMEPLRLPLCPTCGCEDADAGSMCNDCPEGDVHFEAARAFTGFFGTAETLVEKLKYSGRTEYAPTMARPMARVCFTEYKKVGFNVVAPVPLYSTRERERGFNQAKVLADSLAEQLFLPVNQNLVKRIRPTATQTSLTRKERAKNIKDEFSIPTPDDVAGKTILLVDDVYTTGATLNECAGALKSAGAEAVYCIAFARALFKK
jgi:ComF family protein